MPRRICSGSILPSGRPPRTSRGQRPTSACAGKTGRGFHGIWLRAPGSRVSANYGTFCVAFIPAFFEWTEGAMNLRVIESQWNAFIDRLRMRTDVETAGIILAERLHGGEVLLARDMIEIPSQGYLIRRGDQLRLDTVTLNRIIRAARDGGLSVITVHTHPGTTHPWFSAADDHGDARLMPSLFHQMPGPHGSVVIAGGSGLAAGRVW